MREPYQEIIQEHDADFVRFGLTLTENTEYRIVYTGSISVTISTERYYHPSLSVAITDQAGVKRELGLLEKVVNPTFASRHKLALTAISRKNDFEHTDVDVLLSNGSFRRYVEIVLDQTLEFLDEFRSISFRLSALQQQEYEDRERVSLRRFGIH